MTQYGCAVTVATAFENSTDFFYDAVNEFTPTGLEQFGAMLLSDMNMDNDIGTGPGSLSAIS